VEIKAVAADAARLDATVRSLASGPPETIAQTDIFFRTMRGRLKLRLLSPESGTLIFYERNDEAGPRTSTYATSSTDRPLELRDLLAAALGEDGIVRKTRKLYRIGRTRVHIDSVEGLGHFVELEVVLDDEEPAGAGHAEARDLMVRLGIRDQDLVEGAYADLLRGR
jgi:adenylate cyclase class IV